MSKSEAVVSRVRDKGRKVFAGVTGEGIIDAMRQIVQDGAFAKINGTTVDLFSASAVVTIYDNVSDANKAKLLTFSVPRIIDIAFATLRKVS